MADERRYDRVTGFRQDSDQYDALLRLVARGQYESPAHAIRRAVTMLLAFHGETAEPATSQPAAA